MRIVLNCKDLYDLVVPSCRVGNIRQGYVLKDDLLFRIWALHGDGFVQVVLPEKFRTSVVQTAHDNIAGHMGSRRPTIGCYSIFSGHV